MADRRSVAADKSVQKIYLPIAGIHFCGAVIVGGGARLRCDAQLALEQYAVLVRFSCGNALWGRPTLWLFLRFAGRTESNPQETTHNTPERNISGRLLC